MAAPDVNLPHDGFAAESDTLIRVPLTYIKGLGRGVLDRWREEIRRHPFRDAADFCRRVRPRPSEVQLLIDAGAFDGFGLSRPELFWQTRQLTGGAPGSRNGRRASYQDDIETGDLFLQAEVNKADGPHSVPLASSQCLPKGTGRMPVAHSLRAAEEPPGGDDAGDDNDPPGLYSLPSPGGLSSPTTREMTAREYELFGFPVSLDPFAFFGGGDVHWDSYCSTADAANFHDQTIELCGIVMQTRRSHTSRGEIMEFCTLADPAGFIEAQLWPRTYRKFGHRVRHGEVIAATANVQPFDNKHGQVLEITRVGDPRR